MRTSRGVKHRVEEWGQSWTGTPDELASLNLAPEAELRRVLAWRRGEGGLFNRPTLTFHNGREAHILARRRPTFEVYQYLSDEERAMARLVKHPELGLHGEDRILYDSTERKLKSFPTSGAEFQRRCVNDAEDYLGIIWHDLIGERYPGCSVDDESRDEILQAAHQFLDAIKEATFSVKQEGAAELQTTIQGLKAKSLRSVQAPAFERFMQQAIGQ